MAVPGQLFTRYCCAPFPSCSENQHDISTNACNAKEFGEGRKRASGVSEREEAPPKTTGFQEKKAITKKVEIQEQECAKKKFKRTAGPRVLVFRQSPCPPPLNFDIL